MYRIVILLKARVSPSALTWPEDSRQLGSWYLAYEPPSMPIRKIYARMGY